MIGYVCFYSVHGLPSRGGDSRVNLWFCPQLPILTEQKWVLCATVVAGGDTPWLRIYQSGIHDWHPLGSYFPGRSQRCDRMVNGLGGVSREVGPSLDYGRGCTPLRGETPQKLCALGARTYRDHGLFCVRTGLDGTSPHARRSTGLGGSALGSRKTLSVVPGCVGRLSYPRMDHAN